MSKILKTRTDIKPRELQPSRIDPPGNEHFRET